ncbi:MAG: peptidase U32 family protein, partial [Selenomonadaceae bacterium]
MTEKKKSVELLAPAGNFDSLIAAVEAGADAVYLGGKHFNMRLHRNDMNFSDEELEKAIAYAHAHDVRVYITINNLISDDEIDDLKTFLAFLDKIQPDAILVQDLAVIELIHEMNIHVPMHASVMMNVHNDKMIEFLKRNGIVRIVA